MSFKIGDKVQWTGHAGGYSRQHVGTVVGIIQRRERLDEVLVTLPGLRETRLISENELPKGFRNGRYPSPRPGESYLVKVGNRTRLYWPHASKLQLALTPEAVNAAMDALTEVRPVLDSFTDPIPDSEAAATFRANACRMINEGDEYLVAALRRKDGAMRVSGNVTRSAGLEMLRMLLDRVMDVG